MSAFFEWLEVEMVTDDDVYVRVGHIIADISQAGQHRGLYVGELSDTLHPTPLAPIRDPSEAYSYSFNVRQMDTIISFQSVSTSIS